MPEFHVAGKGENPQEVKVVPFADQKKEFRRNAFLDQESARVIYGERGKRKEGVTSEFVEIPGDVVERYRSFVREYVTNLEEVARKNPNVLQASNHAQDKFLLDFFKGDRRKLDDTVVGERLDTFLKDKRGWEMATMLLEQTAAMKLAALGVYESTIPEGDRNTMPTAGTIRTGIDQGIANRLYYEKVAPHLPFVGKAAGLLTGAGVGGAIGYDVGGRTGGIIGAASVLLSPVLEKVSRPGVVITTEQSAAALQMIKSNPTEAAFAKRMWGIDVNDFTIRGGNIERSPGMAMTNRDPNDIKAEVRGLLDTRQDFYQSIGVPRDKIDRLPEQFIFDSLSGTTPQIEQLGVRFQEDFLDALDPNNTIKDRHGVRLGDSAFSPEDINVRDALEKTTRARAKVMTETIKEFLEDQNKQETLKEQPIKIIDEKITARTAEDGKIRQEKTKVHTERIEALGKDKTALTGEEGKVTAYENAKKELDQARSTFSTEFPLYATLTDAIREKRHLLTDTTDPAAIPLRKGQIARDEQAEIDRQWLIKYPTGVPATLKSGEAVRQYNSIAESVKPIFDVQREQVREEEKEAKKDLDRLLELQRNEKESQDKLAENQDITKTLNETLKKMGENRTLLLSFGITAADLTSKPVHELLALINASTTPGAWKESDNSKQENRDKLLLAISEQKALDAEAADATRTARLPGYNKIVDPATFNYSPNNLRILPITQIEADLTTKATTLGIPVPTHDEVQQAVDEANNRIKVRREGMEETIENLNNQIEKEDEAVKKTDLTEEVTKLQITNDLLNTYGPILGKTGEVVDNAGIAKFADTTKYKPTDVGKEVTQEEKDAKAEKGYYEFMELLFGYREKADRGEYFKKISSVLPPKELATLLSEGLDLGLSATDAKKLDRVLAEMRNRVVVTSDVGPYEMRQAFRTIIETLKERALTMP